MARTSSEDAIPARIDEAISWHLRVSAGDVTESTWLEFAAWLEADSANRLAFDQVEDFDAELDQSSPLIEQAEAEAVTLAAFRPIRGNSRRIPAARVWVGASVGLLAASLIVALILKPFQLRATEYSTHIGETKTVTLSDGTNIIINTDSRLRVLVSKSVRHVSQERGEALFHVAKDTEHPFVVAVRDRDVRVVGTVFDVLDSESTITVVVVAGRVRVSPSGENSERDAVALLPGDQLTHSEVDGQTTVSRIDPSDALAWQNGYLVYRNAPLSKVVSDLNRYFPRRVDLADDGATAMRFSGVLKLDRESAVLRRISQFLAVSVETGPQKTVILRASTAKH